jgi:hypothetical protein
MGRNAIVAVISLLEMAVLFQHPRESTSAAEARHPRRPARIPRWCHSSRQGFGSVAVVRILA